jgi:uncharacterized membrane-anchored protein
MNNLFKTTLWMLLIGCFSASIAFAEDAAPAAEKGMSAEEFLASLHFKSGKIDLPNGIATLNLPETFSYLDPADSEKVLVDAWGNPPGDTSLGMIFPAGANPLDKEAWGVVITYDEDGHVKDDDADSINYTDLLKDMQEGEKDANEERKKQGYSALNLVGWAETPSYDKASHKLYWAKELAVEGATEHTLNYNVRILGRKGVLVLNAIAGTSQLGTVKTEMQKVIAFSDFNAGNGYGDFDSGTDKTAEYGIAALVAGGVAAKLGLFGKLFALILAFKKVLILAAVGFFAGIKKFLGMGKDKQE